MKTPVFVIGNRVEVYSFEENLTGDRGTVVDTGPKLRVKLDGGRELEVSAEDCRLIGVSPREKAA